MLDTIHHGPLALDRWLQGKPDFSLYLARIDSSAPLGKTGARLTATTRIGLSGDVASRIRMAPLDLPHDGKRFRMSAVDGSLRMPAGAGHTQLRLGTARIELEEDGRRLLVSGPELVSLGTDDSDTGEIRFEADRLRIERAGRDPVEFQGLLLRSDSREADGKLTTVLAAEVTDVTPQAGESLGPGKLSLELRDLDAAAVRSLRGSGGEIDLATLLGQLDRILRHAPKIVLTLAFETGHGRVDGSAELGLNSDDPAVLSNPLLALTALRASGTLRLPEPVLRLMLSEQLDGELRELENRGERPAMTDPQRERALRAAVEVRLAEWMRDYFFRRDGEQLVVEAEFSGGRFTVNGEPVELGSISPFN